MALEPGLAREVHETGHASHCPSRATMETVDPVPGASPATGSASVPMHVSPPAAEHDADAPAVVAHVEDQHHAEIRTPAEPKRGACEVTVTTDASEYRAGDVISGTVVVNCSVPMDAKVRLAPPGPRPRPGPGWPARPAGRPVRAMNSAVTTNASALFVPRRARATTPATVTDFPIS